MTNPSAAAATAAFIVLAGLAPASAQEYPAFERDGFPLTVVQLQVLGAEHVRECPPASTLAREGMPASPHQLAVLRPAKRTPP